MAVRANVKVFGIGLNKTGTRSLAVALRRLGFRTLHKGDDATSGMVDRAAAESLPLLTYLGDRFDAYLDVDAIARRFAELDAQYAGSKFILTWADEQEWLNSRERHVRANIAQAEAGSYEGSWLEVDREAWAAERSAHHNSVLEHFSGRGEDLLVFDVRGGHGWGQLAPFLGCSVPKGAFPRENTQGQGTYGSESALDSIVRRLHYPLGRLRRTLDRARNG